MKNLIASLLIGFGITFSASAQLANGSIAPDFTLTDIDGNTHHLYDYLSEGKAVFVEFFACHCPTCWAYHNVGRLDSLNESYGPSGTNQVVVLMIEYDEWNGLDEFNGITGWTAGDWVTGNSVPMINAELGDRSIFTDYDMVYFTQIYKICPDKTTKLMNTGQTVAELYQSAHDCDGELSIDEVQAAGTFHVDYANQQIRLKDFENVKNVSVVSSLGQHMFVADAEGSQVIDISKLNAGIYFLLIEQGTGIVVKKIYVR